MSASIEERASFDLIRYANCWEDADILCEALRPGEGKRCLSIASGGDNSFALLAEGAEVVAVDLSPAQLAVVELKAAAIRDLDREQTLAFLGVHDDDERVETFERLKPQLSDEARAYWEAHHETIRGGVIHAGKFESYFHLFRTRVLPWVHRHSTILSLLEPRDEPSRENFYERVWNNLRWRLLFRVFFSRFMMGRLGRDPEFFRYVEGSVATRILERTRYALTRLDPAENPYLEYILTGNFVKRLPRFLRPERFNAVRNNLHRLTLVRGTINDAGSMHAGSGFDGFNLSDIFEYLSPEVCREVYGRLLDTARPGARFAYWNMLAPRRCPADLEHRIRSLNDESTRLFARDKAFFYSAFVIEEAD